MRSIIGYVGQEPVLFSGTIEQNIAKGRIDMEDSPLLTLEQAMHIDDSKNTDHNLKFDI
mgnify:CR=1 FL=1